MLITFITTLITIIVGIIVSRAIFSLISGVICFLVTAFLALSVTYVLSKIVGVRIALYVSGGVILVATALWFVWPSSTPDIPPKPTIHVQVTKAIRGNAFESPIGLLGRRSRVITLEGIGVPGLNHVFGAESRDYLSYLIAGKQVAIVNPSNRRGDLTGEVISPEGYNVQQVMVTAGMAWTTSDKWQREELTARRAKRGLWSAYSLDQIERNFEVEKEDE